MPTRRSTSRHARRIEIDVDAERREEIGAAARRRNGAIAVLGDIRACAGRDERGDRGDVERAAAVAAGAAGVDEAFAHAIGGKSSGVTRSRIAIAAPVISSGVSPFIRSAMRNALFCTSVACPSMTSPKTSCISSRSR